MTLFSQPARRALGLALLVLSAACVSASGGAGPGNGGNRDRNTITSEQLAAAGNQAVFDVVQRLRPTWLTPRGGARSLGLRTEIVVFSDNVRLGGVDALRQIDASTIESIRFLDATTASNQLPGVGSGEHVAGAIVLTRRNSVQR